MRNFVYLLLLGIILTSCEGLKKTSSEEVKGSKAIEISPFDDKLFSAMTQKSLGNLDKAYSLFQQCVELDNTQTLPYYEMARLDIKKNNIDLAISNAQIAVEKNKTNEWYQTVLADAYEKKANYKNAITHYKKAVEINSSNRSYYTKIIENYKKMMDLDGAIDYMNVMENKFGVSEKLSFQKYDILLSKGKNQDAEKELKKLIDHFPNEVRYRGMLAEYYGGRNEIEKALNQYEVMRKMDPENGLLHWQLAHHYSSIGQNKKAFDEFIIAFNSLDIRKEQKIEITLGYLEASMMEDAEVLINVLKNVYPQSSEVNVLAGDLSMGQNDFSGALVSYRNALASNKSDQNLWIKTMKLEYTLGEGKLLDIDGTMATNLFPSQPICYLYKALGKNMVGNYKDAKSTLFIGKEFIIDNQLLMGLFLQQLGTVAHNIGDDQKAAEYFEKAIAKAPKDPQVNGSYLLYLLDKGQLNSVETKLDDSVEPIFIHVKAQLFSLQNKFQKSTKLFEELFNSNSGQNALLMEHFGDLLLKKGNKNEAIKIWQKVYDKTGNPRINNKIQNS